MRNSLRRTRALAALPIAAALAFPLTPIAVAQSGPAGSLGSLAPGSGTEYLDPDSIPQRTPKQTTEQNLPGLPAGVEVEKVEWITDRWANVFIKSAAMPDAPVKVQILLARDWYSQPDRTFPSVWALDGLRARDDESGWTLMTNIASFYADKNVNVILPVGGNSSFYSDWQQPDNGKHYKWETFLTRELPPILKEGWRSNDQRAIVGLSMGGTAAVNLAERHPEMFDFVGSFSGYLDTTSYGMPQGINFAVQDGGGFNAEKMWGPFGSQDWIDHDPKLGIEALKGKTVYVSSGNGNAGAYDTQGAIPGMPDNLAGMGLEVMSRMTTDTFVQYAKRAGVPVIAQYRPSGTHSWPYWQFEMTQAWPHIADTFGLADADRGATCVPAGAIGARVGDFPDLGACISNEYDGPNGGKIQDFRGGRAYWSPATDAHFLWGRIGARYAELGGPDSWLGYPKSEEIVLSGGRGRLVFFEHGNIYWTPQTGPVAVKPDIINVWGTVRDGGGPGFEDGPLGYPTGPEKEVAGGAMQPFEHGAILRRPDGTVQPVRGAIAEKYLAAGGPESAVGWPTAGEQPLRGGAFSRFDKGNIYWSPATGAHSILYGAIFDAWGQEGWENGPLGYPADDQKAIPAGGQEVRFQNGTLREVNGRVEKA